MAAALLLVGAGGPALADYKDDYRVSTVIPAPLPSGLAAERWAELVGERIFELIRENGWCPWPGRRTGFAR